MKAKITTKDMARISICVAILAICSWISIPFAIPFTLQTFGVFSVLILLGSGKGLISIVLFILLGAIGIPVFSGFTGGISIILGPTGGYILGFILIGILYRIFEKFASLSNIHTILVLFLGLIVCYATGTAWFIVVYSNSTAPVTLVTALTWCVFPFIIPDIIKLILATLISNRVSVHLHLK